MKKICGFINMPLAPNCIHKEKAFEIENRGIVMGIGFDSNTMEWFLPTEKGERTLRRCLDVYQRQAVDLKTMEKVMGSINDLAQMAPFVKFYKNSGITLLTSFEGNYSSMKTVPVMVKQDMLVCAKIARDAMTGLPIATRPCPGPLSTLTFYSDAAGASFTFVNGVRKFHSNTNKGIACVGGTCKDDIWTWSRLSWPEKFLVEMRDSSGKLYGSKSTTLESVGILLPMLSDPWSVSGRFLQFKVDNIAVVYGWRNGAVRFDDTATEILKAANVVAAYLGIKIYVQHVYRMSEELAELADILSRKVDHSWADPRLEKKLGPGLSSWLLNPVLNGSLPKILIKELQTKFNI